MSVGGRPNSERPNTAAARSILFEACACMACTSRQARWIGFARKMPRPPLAIISRSTARTAQSVALPQSQRRGARAVADIDPLPLLVAKRRKGAHRDTGRGGAERVGEDEAKGQPIKRCVVD